MTLPAGGRAHPAGGPGGAGGAEGAAVSLVDRFWYEHRVLVREAMRLTLAFLEGEQAGTAGAADGRSLHAQLRRFRQRFVRHATAEELLLLPAVRARGAEGRRLAEHYRVCLAASAEQIAALLDGAEMALAGGHGESARRRWEEAVRCLARRIELEERRYFPVFRVYLVLPPARFV